MPSMIDPIACDDSLEGCVCYAGTSVLPMECVVPMEDMPAGDGTADMEMDGSADMEMEGSADMSDDGSAEMPM